MNARTTREPLLDRLALELAMWPIDERYEMIIAMRIEIGKFIERECSALTPDQANDLAFSFSSAVIMRALEIVKASGGAVGHA